MRITADLDRCVGAGQCVLTEPTVFDQSDDDGTVIVLGSAPEDAETIGRVREAIRICPSQALALAEPAATP
ncbi:ferredoxin [Plantactinospora sp. KLBMP9567]|uniref:ferredoxin n=1 Tax=Plantactinospora sp. KLBMP9567 TaxID=3085900 RepID=UPI002980DB0E|nr:ferredoxin [Plantactinospora sp. KLBMP9567]MDW5324927.1 (4Fe-4S)-binding protein [Plantactinospora sp. KLBMP9567]